MVSKRYERALIDVCRHDEFLSSKRGAWYRRGVAPSLATSAAFSHCALLFHRVCGDLWRLVNSVCMSVWSYFDTFQRTAGGCCRFSTCRMWTNAPGITAGLLAAYCACRVDTYHMTVSPRPKSSVRPHADRKLRPMANFVLTTVLFYNVLISNCRVADSISSSAWSWKCVDLSSSNYSITLIIISRSKVLKLTLYQ